MALHPPTLTFQVRYASFQVQYDLAAYRYYSCWQLEELNLVIKLENVEPCLAPKSSEEKSKTIFCVIFKHAACEVAVIFGHCRFGNPTFSSTPLLHQQLKKSNTNSSEGRSLLNVTYDYVTTRKIKVGEIATKPLFASQTKDLPKLRSLSCWRFSSVKPFSRKIWRLEQLRPVWLRFSLWRFVSD